MADCDVTINVTENAAGQVQIQIPGVIHPCSVQFKINGTPVGSGSKIGDITIHQKSAGGMTISGPPGTMVRIDATKQCPPVEVNSPAGYTPCGPTSNHEDIFMPSPAESGEEEEEVGGGGGCSPKWSDLWKFLGLPLTAPILAFWPLALLLAVSVPRPRRAASVRGVNEWFAQLLPWPLRCLFSY
jgi:hypothetical protein